MGIDGKNMEINESSYSILLEQQKLCTERLLCINAKIAEYEKLLKGSTFKDFNWFEFHKHLYAINKRDALIAEVIFQTAIRITEVLGLTLAKLDIPNNSILLYRKREVIPRVITDELLNKLNNHIVSNNILLPGDFIFKTRNNKQVTRSRLNKSFFEASLRLGIKRISPEFLRKPYLASKQFKEIYDN